MTTTTTTTARRGNHRRRAFRRAMPASAIEDLTFFNSFFDVKV
jgi:hypothetical protein